MRFSQIPDCHIYVQLLSSFDQVLFAFAFNSSGVRSRFDYGAMLGFRYWSTAGYCAGYLCRVTFYISSFYVHLGLAAVVDILFCVNIITQ